ncbi:hypothetical protein V491_01753, partial [Pseudogymnoascus sp. VKM F-3775]
RPKADTTQAELIPRPLTNPRRRPNLPVLADAVQRAPAVYVATDARKWLRVPAQIVVLEVRGHVTQAYNGLAEVAICCAGAVGELVGSEA